MPLIDLDERTLSDADIEAIKATLSCHTCNFSKEQIGMLQSVANNVDASQKLATKIIIYSLVMSILGGIAFALKHILIEVLATGKLPGK